MKFRAMTLGLLALCGTQFAAAEETADEEGADSGVFGGFDAEQQKTLDESAESFVFQTEVSRMMEIIIHSLYSNKEIFIREMISNSEDALDKVRFQSLTDKEALGETEDLEIRISADKDAKTLTIRDTGIGMSRAELIENLGTIAKSGTSKFLESMDSSNDALNLIGQFGVGFYSTYLVADSVTVVSKSNSDEAQWVWQSTSEGSFTIAEDPRGNTLGRGTAITLHLREDAHEWVEEHTLETSIKRYSQFMTMPIHLQKCKTESKKVPLEPGDDGYVEPKEEEEDKEEGEDDDELEVDDDEEEEEDEEPKTKSVTETTCDWEQMNVDKPLWLRRPNDIEEEEYSDFYKALTSNYDEPMNTIHFSAEGEIEFRSLLFIPTTAPRDLYDQYYSSSSAMRLYVRRVLISDKFEDFLPRYLSFVQGLVDSNDLPLNVNREQLQKSKILQVISKKVTRKVLDTLRKMAEASERGDEEDEDEDEEEEAEKEEEEEDADKEEGEEEDEEAEEEEKKDEYMEFWDQYSKSIKLGVIEDSKNRKKLTNLLRYPTSIGQEKPSSLKAYVDRMGEDQKYIYYIAGESVEKVESSPFLSKLKARGFEVLFFVDSLDEYVTQHLTEFEGFKLQSITKDGLDLNESDKAKKRQKEIEEEYEDLTTWLKEILGDRVEKVKLSWRVAESPAVLVTGKYGWSINMERIVASQPLSGENNNYMRAKKSLEINPRHPVVRKLHQEHLENPEDERLVNTAWLLHDQAALSSGAVLADPEDFAKRLEMLLRHSLDIAQDAATEDEEDYSLIPDEVEEEEEDDEDDDEDEDEEEDEAPVRDEL